MNEIAWTELQTHFKATVQNFSHHTTRTSPYVDIAFSRWDYYQGRWTCLLISKVCHNSTQNGGTQLITVACAISLLWHEVRYLNTHFLLKNPWKINIFKAKLLTQSFYNYPPTPMTLRELYSWNKVADLMEYKIPLSFLTIKKN